MSVMSGRKVLLSLLLGLGTVTLIRTMGRLASSFAESEIWEWLLFPGALVAMIVSPGGVHGPRPHLWIPAIYWGNALFYAGVWFAVIRLVARVRTERSITTE
jgi:hypothetical protein